MAENLKKYSKSEILQILGEKCADALAKFPPPSAFEFHTYRRDGKSSHVLKIGHRVSKKEKKPKEVVYVEDHQTFDYQNYPKLPPANQRFPVGNAGPYLGYDTIYRVVHGAEAKDEYNRQENYIGLYYTTADGTCVNGTVYNSKSIKGDGVFGKLSDSGLTGPYSNTTKALYRFILVHCGLASHYVEFKNAQGNTQSLKPLISALKQIAKRTSSEEPCVSPPAAMYLYSNDEYDHFVSDSRGNKRPHDEDDEISAPDKKARKA